MLGALRTFSAAELEAYNGIALPQIYMAFQGRIYDVSARPDLYGAGRGYAALAGRDATRALAKMSLKPEDVGRNDIDDLLASPLAELHAKAVKEWAARFAEKYKVVGTLAPGPEGKPKAKAASWLRWAGRVRKGLAQKAREAPRPADASAAARRAARRAGGGVGAAADAARGAAGTWSPRACV